MARREASLTAEPQKARLRCVRLGRPSARISVDVSERAQQKDCVDFSSLAFPCQLVSAVHDSYTIGKKKKDGKETYQIENPQPPRSADNPHNRLVSQVRTIGQH